MVHCSSNSEEPSTIMFRKDSNNKGRRERDDDEDDSSSVTTLGEEKDEDELSMDLLAKTPGGSLERKKNCRQKNRLQMGTNTFTIEEQEERLNTAPSEPESTNKTIGSILQLKPMVSSTKIDSAPRADTSFMSSSKADRKEKVNLTVEISATHSAVIKSDFECMSNKHLDTTSLEEGKDESNNDNLNDDADDGSNGSEMYTLDGKMYDNYEEYCKAKRERNNNYLVGCGLLDASANIGQGKAKKRKRRGSSKEKQATKRALQDQRRRSSRLKEIQTEGKSTERSIPPGRSSADSLPIKKTKKQPEKSKQPPIVPFCKKCISNQGSDHSKGRNATNLKTATVHHALCPENPQFHKSGASSILEMIRKGTSIGCKACEFHYQNGWSKKSLLHSNQCGKSKNRRLSTSTNTSKSNLRPDKNYHTSKIIADSPLPTLAKADNLQLKNKQNKAKQQHQHREKNRRPDSLAGHKIAGQGKVNSGISVAKSRIGPKSNHRKVKTTANFPLAPSAIDVNGNSDMLSITSGTKENLESHNDGYQGEKLPQEYEFSKTSLMVKNNTTSHKVSKPIKIQTSASNESRHGLATDKPRRKPCPNPWGTTNHVDGEVVLFPPDDSLTNDEQIRTNARQASISTLKRFVSDPFANGSIYFRTHTSPQNGYHVLRLTRDRMALQKWGFMVRFHDFGGACLVKTVDKLSPAEGAVLVGSQIECEDTSKPSNKPTGLRRNDMLICVNGKEVGGMTELGLEAELDLCGPVVILIVSRYKHAESLVTQSVVL